MLTHINHMDILEAGKGQVLKDFAAQASSSNHQDGGLAKSIQHLWGLFVFVIGRIEGTLGLSDVIEVLPSRGAIFLAESHLGEAAVELICLLLEPRVGWWFGGLELAIAGRY